MLCPPAVRTAAVGTYRTFSAFAVVTCTVAVAPMRSPEGGSLSETVTPYCTTLLEVVEVWSIAVTLPPARAPCIASKVTDAGCPFLTLATSASVNSPLICSLCVSATVMKPLPVLPEESLDDEDDAAPLPPLPLPVPEPPLEPLEPLEALEPLEEPPTEPFTAMTVPLNGAVSSVPSSVRFALS